MIRLLYVLIGYAFGCIQTAYIIGKIAKGIDLRNYGSGNLGATNALRVMGKKLGILTFVIDVSKAVAAFMIVKYALHAGDIGGLYAGVGVVLGHNFPFYLKFKGGKGIAVTGGIMLCFYPIAALCIIAGAVIIIFISKYVSLGSIIAMLAMAILAVIKYYNNPEVLILLLFLSALAIYKHKSNIKRLIKGTESKINSKKKAEEIKK
jgi:glycerol-3-phosphate acyltransferase PlsY